MLRICSLFVLVLFSSSALAQVCNTQTSVPTSECNSLISLYQGWNSPPLTGWNSDPNVGNWEGVTVSGGHVTSINLYNKNLGGILADGLSVWSPLRNHLRNFGVPSNNIGGSIPFYLGMLNNLDTLNLWGNNFSGSIPLTLGFLHTHHIALHDNMLTGGMDNLCSVHELESLYLNDNWFSGALPTCFQWNFPNLVLLYVDNNEPNLCVVSSMQSWYQSIYWVVPYNLQVC